MRTAEEVTVTRDVEAVVVPAGDQILIPEGVTVVITQALGGSYTVITPQGYMARVAGSDADALGKEPTEAAPQPPADPTAPAAGLETQIWDALKQIYDPEIPVNIVDLGLVYSCVVTEEPEGAKVAVSMSMTAPGCGMGDVLRAEAEDRIRGINGVREVAVEIVWDPPWDQSRMSEAAKLEMGFG